MTLPFDPSSAVNGELELRRAAGIPDDARQVLIFAESSHWDPNWLYTSKVYYDRWVRANLEAAVAALQTEPRRVYSVECMFFFRVYWDDHPNQQELLRALVNSRRLRLTSSGVTTADTLIPGPEAILRDFLLGQEWLRANGMTQEPHLAYFPDSFGYSHALPSLLNAAGFDLVGITRLDGMYFVGCDYDLPSRYPPSGSSAYHLMKEERTLDFVWRDADGGEALCHWNAFTYGQGDMLGSLGASRVYLFPLAYPDRGVRHVAGQIQGFAGQLFPLSRTPYAFCPIGMDFVAPIPSLLELLDRYNREEYPKTGIWVANAGLDDYLALVDCHRDRLPVVPLDPNPYWTGFYTARPSLKALNHALWDRLVLVEELSLLQADGAGEPETLSGSGDLGEAWWNAAASNHHDFITGTSTDEVVAEEQEPWLKSGLSTAGAALAVLEKNLADSEGRETIPASQNDLRVGRRTRKGCFASGGSVLPEWRFKDGLLEIRTPELHLEMAEEAGGCMISASQPSPGDPGGHAKELLAGPSNDLVSYQDSGGLWRMGMEFPSGQFRERECASQRPARIQVQAMEDVLEVSVETELEGQAFTRTLRVT